MEKSQDSQEDTKIPTIDKLKEQIKADPEYAFRNLSEELRDNEELVLYALSLYHINLYYASKRVKMDEDFMLRAIKIAPSALEFADESLWNDRDFILKAVTIAPVSFCLIPDEFYKDKEIRAKADPEILDSIDKYIC